MKETKLEKLQKLLFQIKTLYSENNPREHIDITITTGEIPILEFSKDVKAAMNTKSLFITKPPVDIDNVIIKAYTSPIGFSVRFEHFKQRR